MKSCSVAVFLMQAVLLVASRSSATDTSADIDSCDVRFEDSHTCACKYISKIIDCYNNTAIIQPCYCMYYDFSMNQTLLAFCYYSCYSQEQQSFNVAITTTKEFNNNICKDYLLNRGGDFCGKCSDNSGLAAYTYKTLSCTSCVTYNYLNWFKYFAITLVPLTVCYILAVILGVNATSSNLNVAILIAQCLTSPQHVQFLSIISFNVYLIGAWKIVVEVCITVFATLNLDFFRLLYPSFCLHPKVSILELLSLEYLVAVYPFFLIFLTYVLVTAYDRQYRLLVFICKPFKWCFDRYHKTWNIRASLVKVFATFILLTYVKILSLSLEVSFLSLMKKPIYNLAGERVSTNYYTIYDPGTKYSNTEHILFAVLALSVSFIFVFLPLLLLALYPCGWFQRCLNLCGGRFQFLHAFMDVFQGCYRTHPRDLRYFSAFYLLLRILLLIQWYIFLSLQMLFISGMLCFGGAVVIAIFQPYKEKYHNATDIVLLLLTGVHFISFRETFCSKKIRVHYFLFAIIGVMILCFTWKLVGSRIIVLFGRVKEAFKPSREMSASFERDVGASDMTDYPPLLDDQEVLTY